MNNFYEIHLFKLFGGLHAFACLLQSFNHVLNAVEIIQSNLKERILFFTIPAQLPFQFTKGAVSSRDGAAYIVR